MRVCRLLLSFGVLISLVGCKVTVDLVGNGGGELVVNQSESRCQTADASCRFTYKLGDTVAIEAVPLPGHEFAGWQGACEGSDSYCEFRVTANHKVSARFVRPDYVEQALNCDSDEANSRCLAPAYDADYYIDQSVKYFLTMDSSVSPFVMPNYSERVVRWEWPPWLLLTGYERFNLIWTDIALKLNPTSYALIDCRAFDTQPFGRCYVVFDYSGELCPIYEEFTFNDQGEITFIEAWTDQPGWLPMTEGDPWAEGNIAGRLSTRVPGLGNATGLVDWQSGYMAAAVNQDADLANLVKRVNDPYRAWFEELVSESQALANGCDPNHVGHEID